MNKHVLQVVEEKVATLGEFETLAWRWVCACGARGHWQYQSESASVSGQWRHRQKAQWKT